MAAERHNVIVTGFGPFGEHKINNSWECVKQLKKMNVEEDLCINLIIQEIPVVYKSAEQIVPALWEKFNPILVVHVGVHSLDTTVIEKCAHQCGYTRNDEYQEVPLNGKCVLGSHEVIHTKLNVDQIRDNCKSCCSTNAGRFLCEYTYYISLCKNNGRCIFVHIPPYNSKVSKEVISDQLKTIIKNCLQQILNFNDN